MKLVETQFSARLRLGDVGDVIGELEAAVATYAYQEGLWELLITALYRAGRQADALATYQRVRTQLADELGLDPGPRLQQLEQQILNHDPALRGPTRAAGNLPSMSAELVGRETEIAALADLLAEQAARRDRRAGRDREDGGRDRDRSQRCREVRPVASGWPGSKPRRRPTTSSTRVIAALNVTGGEAALFERLKGTAAVVILDNCEHVLDAAAALAVRLLDAAPGLRILCTSQVPLDVDGEAVFELAPLALADAVELFTRRATRPADGQRGRRRGARPVPFARRPAAGDRARRGANQDLVDRGDHPPPRRSLQRVERPDQPQAGAPPRAEGDDPVELRAAVPRRPAGPVGACHVRRRRTAPGGRVRPRSARRAGVGGDRRGRPAREPFARDRRRRSVEPSGTGCSTASARSRSRR